MATGAKTTFTNSSNAGPLQVFLNGTGTFAVSGTCNFAHQVDAYKDVGPLVSKVADPVLFRPDLANQNFKNRILILVALTKNQFKHIIFSLNSIIFLLIVRYTLKGASHEN